MACASSMSVSVECVNVCKLTKGEGNGRYDCNAFSCAWKAPRVLTGFLASTAHPPQCPSALHGRSGRKYRIRYRSEHFDAGGLFATESSDFVLSQLFRLNLFHVAIKRWQLCCSSSISSEDFDEVSPESLWEDLKRTISYLLPKELELVQNALKLAFEAHDGQKRRSGEPFIIHPVEVARILGELELDWESIAAGLLHDTVEDTNVVTFERIEEEFGSTVRHIVEGETKVSKLGKLKCTNENDSVQDVKADDLRQMFLAMTEEVRVIIVKLADRLHNMRTLSHMPPHKQSSISRETLQVFAPLAKLLGMYQIKSELENLSFMYTNAEDYAKVRRRVADLYKDHEKELLEANKILVKKIEDDQFLDLMTVKTEVRSACKEPYSIYKAVLKSKGSINEVNQIAQLRIIIKPKPSVGNGPLCSPQLICYHVLGLVHGIWTPIPRTVCICVTRDLLGSRVFVFTPRGEIKNLPKGATVVDYAYMIHTEVGNKMVAAKVNGNLVSPAHVLANAEVVEIITYSALSSKSAFQRHKQWLQHAKTRSARHKIMKFLREQAALSAAEITMDQVNNFVADSEDSEVEEVPDNSKKTKPLWEKILMNVLEFSSPGRSCEDAFPTKTGGIWVPKVNGKHNKHVQHSSMKDKELLSEGNGVAKVLPASFPVYTEVLPGLESWQTSKITAWHNLEGHSILWFCVVCIDRKGIMGEVTTALADVDITICSCLAEIDRGRGMAVMLFHVEGNIESLVNACSNVDLILGVLGWSTGCSWPSSLEGSRFLEC
ncbi:putative GTP diphosphokinase RSH1, chloroplastic [Carica papaya]|uniref:putative GTP diphosphokinase RSH1, chloroplastic n=1 Tax=Carica papaya TaxID=3649 RepID=UPI000B8D0D18|nr:putative GTP diphosphokinase RSH1, chloroplastic [Carica papaya]